MDDTDRKILAFKANIHNMRREIVELGSVNTEITMIRLEQKVDKLLAGNYYLSVRSIQRLELTEHLSRICF